MTVQPTRPLPSCRASTTGVCVSWATRQLEERDTPENAGMEDARGIVVIFVDADDSPPADFLARLRPYYDRGADARGR